LACRKYCRRVRCVPQRNGAARTPLSPARCASITDADMRVAVELQVCLSPLRGSSRNPAPRVRTWKAVEGCCARAAASSRATSRRLADRVQVCEAPTRFDQSHDVNVPRLASANLRRRPRECRARSSRTARAYVSRAARSTYLLPQIFERWPPLRPHRQWRDWRRAVAVAAHGCVGAPAAPGAARATPPARSPLCLRPSPTSTYGGAIARLLLAGRVNAIATG